MGKIDKETSKIDFNQWLEFKKVDQSKRDTQSEKIIVDAISDGMLVIREDMHIEHTLKFEIGDEIKVKTLVYKPRLKMSDIKPWTKNVPTSDTFGLLTAYVCALTGLHSKVVDELDTEDNRIAQVIAGYFL